MATQTPNLNLVLPDYADKADIGVVNDNFKKIDDFSGGGKVEEWLDSIQEKADESLAKIAQDATSYLNNIQKETNESLNEIENKAKNSLESIPDDYEVLAGEVNSLKDQKANVIIDTSARAASHELHAQDGKLHVTLYGKTIETGSGDKSPDNPYTISGVGYARITNKNLYDPGWTSKTVNGVTITVQEDGSINTSGTATARILLYLNKAKLTPGTYVIDSNAATNTFFAIVVDGTTHTSNNGWPNRTFTVTENGEYTVYFVIESGKDASGLNLHVDIHLSGVERGYVKHHFYGEAPLLPDGAPLHGNGTVDDTVENDVLSGCNECVVFDGSPDENWFLDAVGVREAFRINDEVLANRVDRNAANSDGEVSYLYSNQLTTEKYSTVSKEGIGASMRGTNYNGSFIVMYPAGTFGTVDAFRAHLAANPLTVYYRSTDYTPDKDLRVCKTVRRKRCRRITGSEIKGPITVNGYTAFRFGLKDTKPEANRVFIMSHFTEKWACNPGNFRNNFGNDYNVELVISEDITTIEAAKAWFDENNVYAEYNLATPETYMTDPLDLRKPTGIMPVTVMGSAETAVSYPCDTKSYIDRKFDALAAALLS